MRQDELEHKLKDMTREVRDLKTAHERGLGTTRFYRYTLTFTAQSMQPYVIVARVASGEPQNPVIIPEMHIDEPIGVIYLYFSNVDPQTYTLTTGHLNGGYADITITATSSSKLAEFRLS